MENLVRISTYAKYKGISPETVRLWIVNNRIDKIRFRQIDGVYFVLLSKEEYKLIKG